MRQFNEHQTRIWQKMITTVNDYVSGLTNYSSMISQLESLLDVGEYDKELTKKWYSYWSPLEIQNALTNGKIEKDQIENEINKMRQFLTDEFEKNKKS